MEEQLWRRRHRGEIMRRNHGREIMEEEPSRASGGRSSQEAPRSNQERSRRHPGSTLKVPRRRPLPVPPETLQQRLFEE